MNVQTGRLPYECRGRSWDDVTINEGSPKVARKPPEPRGEAWGSDTSVASLGRRLFQTLLTQTLSTKTTHLCVQATLKHLFVVLCPISHCGQGERRRRRGNEERQRAGWRASSSSGSELVQYSA